METLKDRARCLNLDNEKGYVVAVLVALLFASILLVGYYPWMKPPAKTYTTIYLLHSHQAVDYPELLVINQNNTFTVTVEVENHMGNTQNCTVLLKITSEMIHKLPLVAEANATYTWTLENEGKWEIPATITINQPGTYLVVFELWRCGEGEELTFTENACSLNLEVVNES